MLEGQTFEPDGRLAQFMRMVDAFERDEIETAVDLFIARLDAMDGDPDMEDDDRGAVLMKAPGVDYDPAADYVAADGLAGDPQDAEADDDDSGIEDERHDPEEDVGADDRGEPGSWPENGEGGLYAYKSPGATPMPEPDYGEEDGVDGAAMGHNGGPPLDGPNQYKFESGSVMEIDSDADVEIKTPGRPNSAFEPFFQAIVRQIGAAIGVPAGVLTPSR